MPWQKEKAPHCSINGRGFPRGRSPFTELCKIRQKIVQICNIALIDPSKVAQIHKTDMGVCCTTFSYKITNKTVSNGIGFRP